LVIKYSSRITAINPGEVEETYWNLNKASLVVLEKEEASYPTGLLDSRGFPIYRTVSNNPIGFGRN